MKKYKFLLFVIPWLLLVFIGQYVIVKNTMLKVVFGDKFLLLTFLQRITGVLAFTLVFVQVVLGSNMPRLRKFFGNWIFKFHLIEGTIIYLLFLVHPILYLLFRFDLYHIIDPFYIFTQVCLLCKPQIEYFYTFGRIAFWLGTLAVLAASFRDAPGWFSKNWRKVHVLNYFVFFFAAIHGWFSGSDFHLRPLNYIFWGMVLVVLAISASKLLTKQNR